MEQTAIVEQPSLGFGRRGIKVNRLAIGKTLVIIASGLMLLYLTIPLIVVMVRAIDAGLAEQLSQPTVTQAIKSAWRPRWLASC